MKNRFIKSRMLAILLMAVMLAAMWQGTDAFAAAAVMNPPANYRVSDIGYVQGDQKKDWYVDFRWDPVVFPPIADEENIIIAFDEVEWGTGLLRPEAVTGLLRGDVAEHSINEYAQGIKRGCIYDSYLRARYEYSDVSGHYTVQSQKSNPVRFLTGLSVSLELVPGTNNIKIKWDDVWNTNGRIDYRILVSDTGGFTQPPPVPDIVGSEIGKPGSPVTVNLAEKKLEFTYQYALPGREYAIKVVPLPGAGVAAATAEEIPAVTIKTDILLQAAKIGYTNEGDTIWKLSWNPIVKGSSFTRVDYELYRYTNDSLTGQLFRLIPDKDNYQIIIGKDDTNTYSFRVDAKAYAPGNPVPVEFRSNSKVELKEQIPEQPAAPEINDYFPTAAPGPLRYDDLLTSSTASVMWNVCYTGDGFVDTGITYDIYLVSDIREVPAPPGDRKIASDLAMGESNLIRDINTGEILGYKYDLVGLVSNSTYYFVIYAKKNYLVPNPSDGLMITMPFVSKQAVKVIITKPDTGTDRPVAPSSPPFVISGRPDSVTHNQAILEMDKSWHALYDAANNRWEYVTPEDYEDNEDLPAGDPLKRDGMLINYMPGWRIIPHVVEFEDALNVIRMRSDGRVGEFIAYSDLTQPDLLAFELDMDPVIVPDIPADEDQTFDIVLDGLADNATYIVWLTVENQNGMSSDPSDPLIITTPPLIPEYPVTPTVPDDLSGIAADNFVDLFWTIRSGMTYEIRCGTSDNIDSASIQASTTYEDMLRTTFFRLDGLSPNTHYYIWIRAISPLAGGAPLVSEYSNPLTIKTEAYRPPEPPIGFGVRSDGITEHSITYVWEPRADFRYYLEFADNISFSNSVFYETTAGTYTVSSLVSNRKYYARLYAFSTKTNLRSLPTGTVMVVTNKSRSDYDSSYDLDEIPGGDTLVISPNVEGGIWSALSTGVNAHRMAEEIRNIHGSVVKIDLSNPPARVHTVRLELGAVLIDALSELNKELFVRLPSVDLVIRPGSLQTDDYFKLKNIDPNFSLRLEAVSPATEYNSPVDLRPVTPTTRLTLGDAAGTAEPFDSLARPMRVDLPVAGLASYKAGEITAFLCESLGKAWTALVTTTDYTGGRVSGEMTRPGAIMAATRSVDYFGSVPVSVMNSLRAIQSVFVLKSLEGKQFSHIANVKQTDLVKLLLDVSSARYDESDYLIQAARSGIIESPDSVSQSFVARDQAIHLLVSLYRFKTKERIVPQNPAAWAQFSDIGKTRSEYLNSVKFAIENGIVQGNGKDLLNPDKMTTYGELVIMLEKTLRLCGEL
jgi:hypothetical protein